MWQCCKALSKANKKVAPHDLIGKASNCATHFNKEVADELHVFLWEISQLATPMDINTQESLVFKMMTSIKYTWSHGTASAVSLITSAGNVAGN